MGDNRRILHTLYWDMVEMDTNAAALDKYRGDN